MAPIGTREMVGQVAPMGRRKMVGQVAPMGRRERGTNGTYWDKGNGGASGTYGEKVNVYGVFTEKAEVMKPYGRATHIWHDNIKKTSMKEHSKAWTGFICLRAGRSRGIL